MVMLCSHWGTRSQWQRTACTGDGNRKWSCMEQGSAHSVDQEQNLQILHHVQYVPLWADLMFPAVGDAMVPQLNSNIQMHWVPLEKQQTRYTVHAADTVHEFNKTVSCSVSVQAIITPFRYLCHERNKLLCDMKHHYFLLSGCECCHLTWVTSFDRQCSHMEFPHNPCGTLRKTK